MITIKKHGYNENHFDTLSAAIWKIRDNGDCTVLNKLSSLERMLLRVKQN